MKINFKILLIAAFLVTAPLLLLAQPHPNNGSAPGVGNTPVGGSSSAPIGGGAGILVSLFQLGSVSPRCPFNCILE